MPDFDRWVADNGDKTFRLNYAAMPNDVVIDCGAYHGEWSRQIYERYHCKVLAFEPVKAFYNLALRNLAGTTVQIYNSGIGPITTECKISLNNDASSIIVHSSNQETIQVVSIDEIISKHSLSQIRLMKINIEGAEYDLLDHMLDIRATDMIKDIQVQFHQFVENAVTRRQIIRNRLRRTHYLTYDYEFVWENWRAL
jgi:FkbM family methyltransferase